MAEQTAMRKMCGSMAGFSLTKRDTSASSQVRVRPRAVKAAGAHPAEQRQHVGVAPLRLPDPHEPAVRPCRERAARHVLGSLEELKPVVKGVEKAAATTAVAHATDSFLAEQRPEAVARKARMSGRRVAGVDD